jgi:hypothetical protein
MSPHNLDCDSSSSNEAVRMCKACEVLLPLNAFASHQARTDGLRAKCKQCISVENREYLTKKNHGPVVCIDPPAKRQKLEPTIPGEHLYVMAVSTDPIGVHHGLKIGRSGNILRRAHELATSMPFEMLVLATFHGQGHLEDAVHAALANDRNNSGRGREWFHIPLHSILHAVGGAMGVNVNGPAGAAEHSIGSSGSGPIVASSEEEGPGDHQEGGRCLCEEEGREADFPSSSTSTRQIDLRVP